MSLLLCQVEQLEQEVADLQRALSDKQEQESVMLQVFISHSFVCWSFILLSLLVLVITRCLSIWQVLMRVEQEQRVTEDARRFSEQDAAAQRYAAQVLQVA